MWWILVALTPAGVVMAQSELEAQLLRVAGGNRRLAMVPFQQAEALVVQYETLVETQPLLEQLLASAREAGALAAQVFTDEDAALTSPQQTPIFPLLNSGSLFFTTSKSFLRRC